MPPDVDSAALVALLRCGRSAWSTYADLVEERGEARGVLEAELGLLVAEPLDQANADLASWAKQGIRAVSVLDPDYPENLRAVHDRPPLIFVAGQLLDRDARSVAVIGARQASRAGIGQARAISEELALRGYTVTSGLAAGIDSAAHLAALAAGGRTIAVVGTGLLRAYPPQNGELQQRIARDCAVVSRFWPETPPNRKNFPLRNAVMSGMSLATVVVEASHRSGARTQARIALAHGRPVLLMEGMLRQQWAREFAGRPGTHVVDSPAAVIEVVERITAAGTLIA